MMAPSTGTAHHRQTLPRATANAVLWSPPTSATSARAIPIETAVAATAVESASAAVVINSTKATDLCLAAHACRPSCSVSATGVDVFDMSAPRITVQFAPRFAGDTGTYSTGVRRRL